jgi:hypothetical protein
MKFEDEVRKIADTLSEDIAPVGGVASPAPGASASSGAPVNPSGVPSNQTGGAGNTTTVDDIINWTITADPNNPEVKRIMGLEGDVKVQAIVDNINKANDSNSQSISNTSGTMGNPQTQSAAPVTSNTSGTVGATSVGV